MLLYFLLFAVPLVSLLVVPFDNWILSIIQDFLRFLFIPSSDAFMSQVNGVYTAFMSKLPFQSTIRALGSLQLVSSAGIDALNLDGFIDGELVHVPLGMLISPYLSMIHILAEGSTYIFLIRYNIHHLIFLIRGSSFYTGGGSSGGGD